MKNLLIQSHAKVNLYLQITNVLANGYHSLDMVNAKISLCDEIECHINPISFISLKVSDPTIPSDESNTAFKAAQRFFDQTHIRKGVTIKLKKNIPHGAGLGGGSSNAASVLLSLNELFDNPLTIQELQRIGIGIGADVPFFLGEDCSFVKGIGDRIVPVYVHPAIKQQPPWLVLCSPGIHVSTKDAYALWDRNGKAGGLSSSQLIKCLSDGKPENMPGCLFNSFESVIYPEYPELENAYQDFVKISPAKPLLSGSGSNMFSLHTSKEEAENTVVKLQNKGLSAQLCRLML